MIKAPCLFYEIIISRKMHNNWCISQSTTKKRLYINTLISFYQFMHDTSMGYPYILRQTPIFCMNTQKNHTKIGKKAEPCFYHLSIPPPLELFPFYHYPRRTIRLFVKVFLADPPMILLPWQGRPCHIAKAPLAKQFFLLAIFQTFR